MWNLGVSGSSSWKGLRSHSLGPASESIQGLLLEKVHSCVYALPLAGPRVPPS